MEKKIKQEVVDLFLDSKANGKIKLYRKFQKVDARPAKEGEVIVTILKTPEGNEVETKNVAKEGDMVVRARTESREEYIISGKKFGQRYQGPDKNSSTDGYYVYNPIGTAYAFKYYGGSFKFDAPWGEEMICHDGDMICSPTLEKTDDIYRIAKKEFIETYTLVE